MKRALINQGIAFLAVTVINTSFISAYTIMHETNIFGKWLACQQVYQDRNISQIAETINDVFLHNFTSQYQKNIVPLKQLSSLLSVLTNGSIQADGYRLQAPVDECMRDNFSFLYEQIESNIPAFIECLAYHGMASAQINHEELGSDFAPTMAKYKAFVDLLFAQDDSFKEDEYRLAFANRLFEYCFTDATFPHYQNILTNHDQQPVGRFINTSLWQNLVGEGWRNWHKNPLDALKEKANTGHEIVYIAGGTDFYHFLRNGIYNITIVDPFLPTQEPYFSEGWEYLISSSSLDNEIRFGPSCNSIKMKCVDHKTGTHFYSKLSKGNIISLKQSTITWNVYDRDNQHIGHVIIHRRPATQEDFKNNPTTSLIMSYDELAYVAMPDLLSGWGIDPTIFDDDLVIHVKQLRKPVGKEVLCNIRLASMLNLSDLRFISLASDPT